MSNNTRKLSLTETQKGIEWVKQFNFEDQADANLLLSSVRWVSASEFSKAIKSQVEEYSSSIKGPVGIFLERELRKPNGSIQRFYKQSNKKPKRAFGAALQPIENMRTTMREVGSEAALATIITQLVRNNRSKYYLTPSAEEIRSKKIRSFLIVTDTIGSGKRCNNMLESLWKVASVKSWKSYDFIEFGIVSFAVTEHAKKLLESHQTKPKISTVMQCPTLKSLFNDYDYVRLSSLCRKYNPKKNEIHLGYGNQGVLIAYSHGVPNNMPSIFYDSKSSWQPLFPNRTTNGVVEEMNTGDHSAHTNTAIQLMKNKSSAASTWLKRMNETAVELLSVMYETKNKPRSIQALSMRTGISITQTSKLLNLARYYGWIDKNNRLTDNGIEELSYFNKPNKEIFTMESINYINYYPISLRTPTPFI